MGSTLPGRRSEAAAVISAKSSLEAAFPPLKVIKTFAPDLEHLFEIQRTHIKAESKLLTGKAKIEVETRYVERKPAGPLKVALKVNGEEVGFGEVPVSAPLGFTANDALDFGIDLGSPVGIEYYDQAPFPFNGKILGSHVKYVGDDAKLNGREERQIEGPIPVAD
jgi:hypothetical protein